MGQAVPEWRVTETCVPGIATRPSWGSSATPSTKLAVAAQSSHTALIAPGWG